MCAHAQRLFVRGIVLLCICVELGCGGREERVNEQPGELRVLARAPDASGRYLCRVDSIGTALVGRTLVDCDVGGDTSYSVDNDTIVFVSRYEKAPEADPALSMLDYWKTVLAPDFERRLGGRPTEIVERTQGVDFSYFEAFWDRPDGTRELVSVSRREPVGGQPSRRVVKRVTLDCRPSRPSRPIGCK